MKYIKKFNSLNDASGYAIPNPFIASVELGEIILLIWNNLDNKKLVILDGKVVVEDNKDPEPSYPGLKFKSTGNSTISLNNRGGNAPDMKYSLDDGETWTLWDYSSISLTDEQWICFKGNNTNGISSSYTKYSYFVMTGSLAASGNIMSLIDDGACETLVIPCEYCYYFMFGDCSSLTSAPELPATTLAKVCYVSMFRDCSSLTSAPELPATTLALSCYILMFEGCTNLTSIPALPATTLASGCYSNMFGGCTSLTSAPTLPATTLASNCYLDMFLNCTSLTSAPELPANTLALSCYASMFLNCTSLTSAPELPANTLALSCYASMFLNCSSLTSAPALPTTTLALSCYQYMFLNCSSLTSAPELPATTLALRCYEYMFLNCSSLTSAPELPATTLALGCYYGMFSGCSNLSYIKCLATSGINTNNSTDSWTYGVSSAGAFVKDPNATWPTGNNGIPSTWYLESDIVEYNPTETFTPAGYVTFTALQQDVWFGLAKKSSNLTMYVSKNGTNWMVMNAKLPIILNNNETVYVCGNLTADNTTSNYTLFGIVGRTSASGNCNALWNYTNLNAESKQYCGYRMFRGCSSLTSAPTLPATTLALGCYSNMFYNCRSLTSAPELPATTLVDYCYNNMFYNCSNLTSAPELPATSLAYFCYNGMFCGCSNLTSAPELPATTLANDCYAYMFENCSNLTSAPELTSTTLADNCYRGMFSSCARLTSAPELPATTLAAGCYDSMFLNCSNITSISLNNNLTTIPGNCMVDMLTGSITIPNSVTSIDEYAFDSGFSYEDISSITGLVVNGVTYERAGDEYIDVTLANGTSVTLYFWQMYECFLPDTLITLADGLTKQIKDLTYNDELKVWNFDEGHYDTASIAWLTKSDLHNDHYYQLTFSDGTILKTTGVNSNHKIYCTDTNKFEGVAYIEIGSHVYTENGIVSITDKQYIEEDVEYYNVITSQHFGCFANGVLTSNRYGNMYEIDENMMFIKEQRPVRPYSEFAAANISEYWYEPLRLSQQKDSLDSIKKYIVRLESQMRPLPTNN